MGLFDFLIAKKPTANIAKDRLRIIVAHERSGRGSSPDYLPMLQREQQEVIRKYVKVDDEAVKVDLIGEGDNKVLDISVALPENAV